MKKIIDSSIIILFSVFFVAIFYKQMIGLNLFLYNIVLLALLIWRYKAFNFENKTHLAVLSGVFLTALGILFHASNLAITINIISLILLIGVINNQRLTVLANILFSGIGQFFGGITCFLKSEKFSGAKTTKIKIIWRWIGLTLVPAIAFILFYMLYSASSSKFSATFGFIGKSIGNFLNFIFGQLNFSIIFLFCFGFIISCAYFVKTKTITVFEEPGTDSLVRMRARQYSGHTMGLLTEFRIGIITFSMLNALLLVFNIIDISTVWINFKWNGELLREFVHEGTYILIFTLMISAGIVLFFFRKNQNFFSKNKPLKILANIWLIQNMVMTLSVLVRNLHYIDYYNLAYLRIGVMLFVVMALFGLIIILIKVNKTKNFFYLLRVHMLFSYMALVIFSLADWDVIIAKFNFSRSDKAFVHLEFMVGLSDKALPYLDKSEDEVIKTQQNPVYTKVMEKKSAVMEKKPAMEASEYLRQINQRKASYLENYPKRSFLEWNYADYKAYKKLADTK